jgi:hypothetical protein
MADDGKRRGLRSAALYAAIAVALLVLLFLPDILDWLSRRG